MAAYFFDASALVKRYLLEPGSEWVRRLLVEQRPRVFISTLSGPEVLAAIMRKGRAGDMTPTDRDRAARAFRREFETGYVGISPGPAVIRRAMDLLLAHPLRAYDAVQLATALVLPPLPDRTPLICSV